MSALYESDFYGWCNDQSSKLKSNCLDGLDLKNLAEEIEGMGRSEKREMINRLAVLICHILKWEYQQTLRCNSWKYTIWEQQERVSDLLYENPSLSHVYEDCLMTAYSYGKKRASIETGLNLDIFPISIEFDPLMYKGINS